MNENPEPSTEIAAALAVPSLRSRIRSWRLDKAWTQRQLAALLGVTISTIVRWEKGENRPSLMGRDALERNGFRE